MKALLLALAAASALAAAPSQEPRLPGPALTPAEIAAITKAITEPAIYIARWSGAAVKARVKLALQIRERLPKKELPDEALVRVTMRLTLRLNNAWLDGLTGRRIYPGPEDFKVFAAAGLAGLKRYAENLPAGHTWGPVDDKACQDLLDLELRRGVNRLPVYRGRGWPPEPLPSPEEREYLGN